MPITIADMIDEDAELEIHCMKCGKISVRRGPILLAKLGETKRARDLQRKLKCRACGMTGELRLTFPDEVHKHERLTRGLDLHARLPRPEDEPAP